MRFGVLKALPMKNVVFADMKPSNLIWVTQKKRELFKNPTKIEEIQEKKIIDRN